MNHGFVDGNKRTTLHILILCLTRSGYEIHASAETDLNVLVETMILDVVEHRLDLDGLGDWFRSHLRPMAE